MSKRFDVVCVGNSCQDIILRGIPTDALLRDTSFAESTLISVGGDASNESVVLTRLGCRTALVTKMGADPMGDFIHSHLVQNGVDLTYAVRCPGIKTGFAVAVVKTDGERSFLVSSGENGRADLAYDELDLSFLDETRAVTAGSLFALGPALDLGGMAEIFRHAQAKGVLTIADMTADSYGIGGTAIAGIYPFVDYMVPSLEEATYATGETDLDKISDKLLAAGVKNVIIKLGGKGCFLKNKNKRFFVDPFSITPVDTTGCGDNFLAGFLSCLLLDMSLEQSAKFGCATGALNALSIGAHDAVQSRRQIEEFMRDTPVIPLGRS